MVSRSDLYVANGGMNSDNVEYEPLQTPPTMLPETPLVDVYAGPGVIDSSSGETDIGIAASETVYLSTSAFSLQEPNNGQQDIDGKLITPENSLTQIYVVHQPTVTFDDGNITEQDQSHVDQSDCSPENISQVAEIEESNGIVLVMQGELLSVSGPTTTDSQCVEEIVTDVTTDSHSEETSLALGGNTKSKSTKICLQVVREDGSMHNMNVVPVAFCASHKSVPSSSEKETMMRDNKVARDDRLFMCDLCDKTFNRPGNYKRHRMIHILNTEENNSRYKCEVCNRPFLQRCDLKRHMQVHSGNEPFRCEVCDKGYIRRSDLVVHMRFHNKERLFKCDSCDKKFHQSGDLRRHVRLVHTKSKVLLCRHCPHRYTTETTFLRHMQTAHRDIILKSLDEAVRLDGTLQVVSIDGGKESGDRKTPCESDTSTSNSKNADLLEPSSSTSSSSSLTSSSTSVSTSSSSSL